MPLYTTRCKDCHGENSVWRRIPDRDRLDLCLECGGEVFRIVSAPAVAAIMEPYVSPKTGRIISDRRQQADDLLRGNCILAEPGLQKDVKRWGEETREKAFAPIAAGVDAAVNNLVNSGKIES